MRVKHQVDYAHHLDTIRSHQEIIQALRQSIVEADKNHEVEMEAQLRVQQILEGGELTTP